MIRAVMGAGPRTGTSFVMRSLRDAGVPIFYSECLHYPEEGNPDGYFETHELHLAGRNNQILKVWPTMAKNLQIERMVVLRRDRDAQLESVRKQMTRERIALRFKKDTAEDYIDFQLEALAKMNVPHWEFRTEELDDNILDIIDYLRYD